jgi:sulfate adenylyltransferase
MNSTLFLCLVLVLVSSVCAFRPVAMRTSNRIATRTGASGLSMISEPHGGTLVNTLLKDDAAKKSEIASCDFEVELDERQLCDVELLMQGGFSPLTGYMGEGDYKSVVENLSLENGLIFSLPIVYDTDDERVQPGKKSLNEL